jgi:hypothetical protein
MRFLSATLIGVMTMASLSERDAPHGPVEPTLVICFDVAADGSAIFPTSTVPAQNRELMASFHLASGEHVRDLHASWIAVDVGSAAPPNTVAGQGSLHLAASADHGTFRFTLPRDFPVGRYRLDVTASGQPWHSVEFTVADGGAAPVASLRELVPLDRGRVFTYAYTQRAEGPARITSAPSGATLQDGQVRAVVTMRVVGEDANGAHMQWQRGGHLYSEEWWRNDPTGLNATQRAMAGETLVLDPPQPVLPWPAEHHRKWTYRSRDHRIQQENRLWGPTPIAQPSASGLASGYVVLIREKSGQLTTTVERHFIPSKGLVRSITTTVLGQQRVGYEVMEQTAAH